MVRCTWLSIDKAPIQVKCPEVLIRCPKVLAFHAVSYPARIMITHSERLRSLGLDCSIIGRVSLIPLTSLTL
jgi:hypothetical protein